jgi:hypothetical protein
VHNTGNANNFYQAQVGNEAATASLPNLAGVPEVYLPVPLAARDAAAAAEAPVTAPSNIPSWSSLAAVTFYEPLSSVDDEEGLSDLEETVMGRGYEAAACRSVDGNEAAQLS